MTTIKDISKKCGYSVSTISKALNDSDEIGEETKKKIKEAAKEMGYFPNAAARLLKTNRSNNIGVLFVDEMQSGLTHEYFSAVLNSLKVEAEGLGFDITFISQNIGDITMSYYEHARYRNCDGIVIACVDFYDPAVIELINSDIPTVTIDHMFNASTAILSDNLSGSRDLVHHIAERGHTRIAFIHGEDTTVTQRRLAGFHKACSELKIRTPESYLKRARYHDPKSSAIATRELLSLPERPTCIMYPDDFSFIGGMNEIEHQGLSIPDDISVAGYDGIYLSQVLRPKLTTYRQDTESLGREAARQIISQIADKKTFVPRQIWIKGELLVGDSIRKIGL